MKIFATVLAAFLSLSVAYAADTDTPTPLTPPAIKSETPDSPPKLVKLNLTPPQAKPLIIGNDPGGGVTDYVKWYSRLDEIGLPIIVEGKCISACTIILAYSNFCVTKDASFGFHAALNAVDGEPMVDLTKQIIYQFYPPIIRKWFLKNVLPVVLKNENEPVYLSAEELVKMGAAHFCITESASSKAE